MRVLFVIAPWSFKELYPPRMTRGATTITGASAPLGIMYLSACLKQAGHATGLVDGKEREVAWILERVREFGPDLVAFSCTSFAWKRTVVLAQLLKEALPGVLTLAGGPHVTGVAAACLEEGIDYGLTGDAEKTIVELVRRLEAKQDLAGIPGLAYRKADGKLGFAPGQFFKDLDSIPFPDYDLLDVREYPPSIAFYNRLPSMTMMTTRGCPALCTFCDVPSNFRVRSVDNVIAEIRHLQERFGVKHILFYDEDIALAKRRLHEMCRRFIAEQVDITWCCNARADSVDEETVKLMRQAGCWRILVGMETGTQELLDQMMKGCTLETLKGQVQMIRRQGIEVMGTFILGLPGETYAMGLKTVDFAIECDLDYAIFLKLTPFPGLPISKGIETKGRLTGRMIPNLISFVPHTMTEEELAGLAAEAVRRFYMRPGYLLRRGLKMRSWDDLKRNLRGFFSFFGLTTDEYLDEPAEMDYRTGKLYPPGTSANGNGQAGAAEETLAAGGAVR